MTRRMATSSVWLSGGALACWTLMFLAAHDVWHDTGRIDVFQLEGPPYADLRALIITFYVLLPLLAAQFLISVLQRRKPNEVSTD